MRPEHLKWPLTARKRNQCSAALTQHTDESNRQRVIQRLVLLAHHDTSGSSNELDQAVNEHGALEMLLVCQGEDLRKYLRESSSCWPARKIECCTPHLLTSLGSRQLSYQRLAPKSYLKLHWCNNGLRQANDDTDTAQQQRNQRNVARCACEKVEGDGSSGSYKQMTGTASSSSYTAVSSNKRDQAIGGNDVLELILDCQKTEPSTAVLNHHADRSTRQNVVLRLVLQAHHEYSGKQQWT
jgi:hypothetical protein